MAGPTLHDLFPIERGTDVPDNELTSWTSRARRDFLRGKRIIPGRWADETGGNNGAATSAKLQLAAMGFVIAEKNCGHLKPGVGRPQIEYWIANLDHEPTEQDIDMAIDRGAVMAGKKKPGTAVATAEPKPEKKPAPKPPKATNTVEPDVPILPALTQHLSVYALVQNDDETITIGLRNGTRKWTATLTGVIEQ